MTKRTGPDFDGIDELIRRGEIPEAQARLDGLFKRRVARPDLARVCNLLRRAGLWHRSLKLLNPVVRPRLRGKSDAKRSEIIEYGAALIRAGAHPEAIELLTRLQGAATVEADVLLLLAFAHFARWDYATALRLLRELVARRDLDAYGRAVAESNLAAALVHEGHFDEASRLLDRLIEEFRQSDYRLLLTSALEFKAQNFLNRSDFDNAARFLEICETEMLASQGGGMGAFFLEKWKVFFGLLTKPWSPAQGRLLNAFREKAAGLRHWETLRSCDLYEAKVRRDPAIALRLYAGTPYPAYREKILGECGAFLKSGDVPKNYVWNPNGRKRPAKCVDVLLGETEETFLRPGFILHRLLAALASDFYRPHTLGGLHAAVFPRRHYNPVSSPDLLHQALKRLRQWLEAEKLPFAVSHGDGFYTLRSPSDSDVGLLVPIAEVSTLKREPRVAMRELAKAFRSRPFTASEAAEILRQPRRTVGRNLNLAVRAGLIEATGSRRSMVYRIKGAR